MPKLLEKARPHKGRDDDTLRKTLPDLSFKYGYRALATPYGIWQCGDGREVVFSRSYNALWERRPGEPARRADPYEFVSDIVEQTWLYNDGTPAAQVKAAVNKLMAEWGVTPVSDQELDRLAGEQKLERQREMIAAWHRREPNA